MKKLSIAVVLMAASFTFANAQTTDSVKVSTAETTTKTEMTEQARVAEPAENEAKMEAMKAEDAAVKKETPNEMKQKAKMEKKMEAKKETVE